MTQSLSRSEMLELVLHTVVSKLLGLAIACRMCEVPQKWIGSSVALGFDCATLPARSVDKAAFRNTVTVMIFDWGRSELNTCEKHERFSPEEQRDRTEFWRYYTGGICRLSWEAARAYQHWFGQSNPDTIRIKVFDFDSSTDNDVIGQCMVPLKETSRTSKGLVDRKSKSVIGRGGEEATITFSVTKELLPENSRMKLVWRIHVHKANNLLAMDGVLTSSTSDPFVTLEASSSAQTLGFWQRTSVQEKTLDPEWNETFEVAVPKDPAELHKLLAKDGMTESASHEELYDVLTRLPCERSSEEEAEKNFREWDKRLGHAVARKIS